MTSLLIVVLTTLTGCQTTQQFIAAPQRPAPPQVPAAAVPPVQPGPVIQPAKFEETVPPPAVPPEALPQGTLKPVVGGALTLAELEEMAMSANPSVARAAALVQAASGNYTQVGLPPNPTVGYEGQQIGSRGLAEQDGVFINQEIVRGGKLKLNRQVAAQEWARAEHELAAQQQRVQTDVRIAFYNVLIAQSQEDLFRELEDSSKAMIEYSEKLQKAGERSRPEVIQVILEREKLVTGSRNANRRRSAAWQELATVVGDPRLPPARLEGDADESHTNYEWESTLQRLLSTSPEVGAAIANVERARWAVQRALVEKVPNVTVQGLVNARDNGIGGRSDGSLTIGVPLPIWNRNQGGVIQAQGQVAAAERALEQLELDLQNRLALVFERYSNARDFEDRYEKLLKGLTDEWLKQNEMLREGGEASQLDVILFQRTYAQTKLDYLDALRERRKAEAEIEGMLLSGSLQSR
ncbi:MAG: TolC family protein [Pirellulaceae bacterium]